MGSRNWSDVQHLEFSAQGARVIFRNSFFLFGDEEIEEAPTETLLVAAPIKGNYGEVISAEDVAKHITELLNRK